MPGGDDALGPAMLFLHTVKCRFDDRAHLIILVEHGAFSEPAQVRHPVAAVTRIGGAEGDQDFLAVTLAPRHREQAAGALRVRRAADRAGVAAHTDPAT